MKRILLILTCILSVQLYSQSKIMVINGNADWTDTGLDFHAGKPGFVFASGYVIRNQNSSSFDNYATPAGRAYASWPANSFPCQTCNATSLIGKVGINGRPFLVGERAYINQTGRLYLRVNDDPLLDNKGAFVAVMYPHVEQIASRTSNSFIEEIIEEFGADGNILTIEQLAELEEETIYSISPNPAKNKVEITFKNRNNESSIGVIRVYDLNGKEIISKTYENSDGDKINFDISKLKKGIYLISIEINGEAKNSKLIVN